MSLPKTKPSYVPNDAWEAYQNYNHGYEIVKSIKSDALKTTAAQISMSKSSRSIEEFYDAIFHSNQSKELWPLLDTTKISGEDFVNALHAAKFNGKSYRDKIAAQEKNKNISMKHLVQLRQFLSKLDHLKELNDFYEETNFYSELDRLEKILSQRKENLEFTGDTPSGSLKYALSFRKTVPYLDFARHLIDNLCSNLGYKYDIQIIRLVIAAGHCLYPGQEPDEQDFYKIMIPPHSRRKK